MAELAPADTCVSPVLTAAEVAGDAQFAARGAIVEATLPGGGSAGLPATFRQVGPVLAGMAGAGEPTVAGDPSASDTDELLAAAGTGGRPDR